jgi:hypothetical protein
MLPQRSTTLSSTWNRTNLFVWWQLHHGRKQSSCHLMSFVGEMITTFPQILCKHLLDYEPVWLRGRGCVFLKMHWVNVWLRKKSCLLCIGLSIYCVRDAGKWKAANCCFLCGQTFFFNSGACLNCSLNRFFLKKQNQCS